jgi:hypothetical protein
MWITINMSRILKLSVDSVLVRWASNQEYSSRKSSLALKRIESLWQYGRGLFRWLEIQKLSQSFLFPEPTKMLSVLDLY